MSSQARVLERPDRVPARNGSKTAKTPSAYCDHPSATRSGHKLDRNPAVQRSPTNGACVITVRWTRQAARSPPRSERFRSLPSRVWSSAGHRFRPPTVLGYLDRLAQGKKSRWI